LTASINKKPINSIEQYNSFNYILSYFLKAELLQITGCYPQVLRASGIKRTNKKGLGYSKPLEIIL